MESKLTDTLIKYLLSILKWVVVFHAIYYFVSFVCTIAIAISYVIIYDLTSLENIETFLRSLETQLETGSADSIIRGFFNTFVSNLPFAAMIDGYVDYGTSIFGTEVLLNVYSYFFGGGKKSCWDVIVGIFPELAQGMIAGFFIHLLLSFNRIIYSFFDNAVLKIITGYISYGFYGFTGFFCAAAVTTIFKNILTPALYPLVISMVGVICLLSQALSQAGVFEAIITKRKTRNMQFVKEITNCPKLNASLLKALIKLLKNTVWAFVNTILVWGVCTSLDGSLIYDINTQIKFYSALLIFMLVLFIENHSFAAKKKA